MSVDRSIFEDHHDWPFKAYEVLDREGNQRKYVISLQQKEIKFVRPEAYVKQKKRPNGRSRKRHRVRGIVFNRDNFSCVGCGKKFKPPEGDYDGSFPIKGLTLGHVIPHCQGGEMSAKNIRAQCDKCNSKLADNVWVAEVGRY